MNQNHRIARAPATIAVLIAICLAAASCSRSATDGSLGDGSEVMRYWMAGGLGRYVHPMIFVWDDGTFDEYWIIDAEVDVDALLASEPQNSGQLADAQMDALSAAILEAREANLPEVVRDPDCFSVDAPNTHFILGGDHYQEPDCPDDASPLARAKEVAELILARDVIRPKFRVYSEFDEAVAATRNQGALVAGEVISVEPDGGDWRVEITATETLVGGGPAVASVLVVKGSASDRERLALADLEPGADVWVVVDGAGAGLSLAALDDEGQLLDWGPSESSFALGHIAFLAAANQTDRLQASNCISHPSFARVNPELSRPANALVTTLQKSRVAGFEDRAREARRATRDLPAPPAVRLALSEGDPEMDYVVVEESGRFLRLVSGESSKADGGERRSIAPQPGVDVHIYAIDLSITGCGVEGNKDGEKFRRGYLAAALGELVTVMPARLFEDRAESDILIDVNLSSGIWWTEF